MGRQIIRVFIILFLLLCNIIAVLPVNAYIVTAGQAINGEGFYVDGAYVGGGATFANLNSDDGDTEYLNVAGTLAIPLRHFYNFADMATFTPISVSLYFKVRYMVAGEDEIRIYARQGGVDYYKDTYTIDDTGYTLYSVTWDTDPSTGLPWTLAGYNSCQFGLEFQGTYRWTYAYAVFTYDYPNYPVVVTLPVTGNYTDGGFGYATFNGEVTNTGSFPITDRGFVWDTVSRGNPGNVDHSLTAYANNWAETGTWDIGMFSYVVYGLPLNTTYYYRACAYNAARGWSYGEEQVFRTMSTPVITLYDAQDISVNSAKLVAKLVNDGGQICEVQFGYGLVSGGWGGYTNFTNMLYPHYSGDFPSVVIEDLAAGTTYYYRVEVSTIGFAVTSAEKSFTTNALIILGPPETFLGKPEKDAINLSWDAPYSGTGVWIRYSLATYPTTINEGAEVYKGSDSSYRLTGLPSGRTVYLSAWGYSGNSVSATYATALVTTLADNPNDNVIDLPTPGQISKWMTTPNSANLQKLPGHDVVAMVATTYLMPETTVWFILGIVLAVALAAFVWSWDSNHNVQAALITLSLGLFGGVVAGIYAGWMMIFVIFMGISSLVISIRL